MPSFCICKVLNMAKLCPMTGFSMYLVNLSQVSNELPIVNMTRRKFVNTRGLNKVLNMPE